MTTWQKTITLSWSSLDSEFGIETENLLQRLKLRLRTIMQYGELRN